jgi:drug/metabolite transporter (DMT)-like permease
MSNLRVSSIVLLLSIGVLGFIAQLVMTYGIRYVTTIKASLLSYTTIPLTIFLGFLLGEELRGKFFLGIVFIFAGLLFNSAVGEAVFRNIVSSVTRKFSK